LRSSGALQGAIRSGGDPIKGLADIGEGNDPLSEAINKGTTEAVKLSYKHYPEETRATLEVLGELGGAADALVTYVDEATGKQFSYQWNALDEKTRNQILGAGKLISVVVPTGTVVNIARLKKLAKTGENVVDGVKNATSSLRKNGVGKAGNATNKGVDDVKLLPPPSSVGSARRLEPGVASHGGSLPTIKEGDAWLKGTAGNAGKVPTQVAKQLTGKEFKTFDEFRQEFWRAAVNDPNLSRQFGADSLREMRAGRAPYAVRTQQQGGRIKYELDHNQELQNGGSVYDMNNIIIRTPLNHIMGK